MTNIELHGQMIISGYRDGTKFRPSTWSEMLSDMAAKYDNLHHLTYADYLRPVYKDDYGHCVEVDFDAMRKDHDYIYNQVVEFIINNHLELYTLSGDQVNYELKTKAS